MADNRPHNQWLGSDPGSHRLVMQPLPASPGSRRDVCFHGGAFFGAIGEEFDDLGRRHAVINADVLDAWFPPAPSVIAALAEHLHWLIGTSPPIHAQGLVRAIARARGVPPACVLAGAGSSDLIFLALRNWLTPASRVLLLDPTYGEYAHVCGGVIGCTVDRLRLHRRDHYRVDPGQLGPLLQAGYDLVILVNPNNPTGQHIPRECLEALLGRLPARTRCWVDEAYVDYAGPDQSLEQFAASMPNIVVCKSLSKVYALSGARAAYLVAAEGLVDELRALTPPWAVSLPAQVAAVHALQAPAYYAARHRQTHELRAVLAQDIRGICPGMEVITGVGNFVLCHLPPDTPDAVEVARRCQTRDLYLRVVGGASREWGDHALRVAVKDIETQRRMLEVLAEALVA
jgi:histidinol-phosphate/aromatic aminotransferase/cobyric acid decarboxylase-like protein